MKIKGFVDEDFVNYKKPSMFIGTSVCNWKCCIEQNIDISICQNSSLSNSAIIDMSTDEIFRRYVNNPITKAIVIGGLEPFLQFEELYNFINEFRKISDDDVVIYTGYYKNEIEDYIVQLKEFKNIVVKYGRYIPNQIKHKDSVLGIYLASNNQYAERIS